MDKKLEHLFTPILTANADEDNIAIFIDQTREIAFGGYRRSWGVGDFFMRYRGPIERFFLSQHPGVYNLPNKQFLEKTYLPGRRDTNGGVEYLGEAECNNLFAGAYQQVAGHHELIINPVKVLEFIDRRIARSGPEERVINIQPFESVNNRQFAGKVEIYNGRHAVVLNTPFGEKPLYLDDRNSLLSVERLKTGEWVVVEPIGVVDKVAIGKVLRIHEPGIRMVIQHFKSGLLMPGDARYSVHEGENGNTIVEPDIETFPFIEPQNRATLANAPMLTIQLDTFIRSLKALAGYKKVGLMYKNSFTPYVMTPYVRDGEPVVDVVASSFCPYKSGKVVTL